MFYKSHRLAGGGHPAQPPTPAVHRACAKFFADLPPSGKPLTIRLPLSITRDYKHFSILLECSVFFKNIFKFIVFQLQLKFYRR